MVCGGAGLDILSVIHTGQLQSKEGLHCQLIPHLAKAQPWPGASSWRSHVTAGPSGPFLLIWVHSCSSGSLPPHLGPFLLIWVHSSSSGTIPAHLGPFLLSCSCWVQGVLLDPWQCPGPGTVAGVSGYGRGWNETNFNPNHCGIL